MYKNERKHAKQESPLLQSVIAKCRPWWWEKGKSHDQEGKNHSTGCCTRGGLVSYLRLPFNRREEPRRERMDRMDRPMP